MFEFVEVIDTDRVIINYRYYNYEYIIFVIY